MNEREQYLIEKTSKILGKNTMYMSLNQIIEELAGVIEEKEEYIYCPNCGMVKSE